MKYPNTPTKDLMYSLLISYHSNLPHINDYDEKLGFILRDGTKKVVLDVGCGFGSEFIFVMETYYSHIPRTIILLDANPLVFKRDVPTMDNGSPLKVGQAPNIESDFRKFHLEGFLKLGGDVCNIPLENNSVDIVHEKYIFADNGRLEEYKERVFDEIHRVLKKDGIYLYSEDYDSREKFTPTRGGFKILKKAGENKTSCYYDVYQKI